MWRSKGSEALNRIRDRFSKIQAGSLLRNKLNENIDVAKANVSKTIQEQAQKGKQALDSYAEQTKEKFIPEARKLVEQQSQKAWEGAKKSASDASQIATEAAKDSSKAAWNRTSEKLHETQRIASEGVKQKASQWTGAMKIGAEQKSRAIWEEAKKTASDASQSATEAAKDSSKAAWNKTSQTLQETQRNATEGVRQRTSQWKESLQFGTQRAARYLFWWSLAIVGVYGFATTLPKELIRYYARKDDPTIQNEQAETKDEAPVTPDTASQIQSAFEYVGFGKLEEEKEDTKEPEPKWWA